MTNAIPHRARTVRLRDGTRVTLRPIAPQDKEGLAAAHERLSPESRYRRYLSPMPRLSHSVLAYLTEVDHRDHEAIVGVDAATGEILAVARYVRSEDPESAEAAVTVADARQGQGLGRTLLDALADRAKEEGVHRFTATVLADNPASIRLLEGLGASERSTRGSQLELTIELPERPGVGPDLAKLLREVAAGSLVAAGSVLHRAAGATRSPRKRRAPAATARRWEVIVVGTDGSEGAGTAVEQAARLATATGCRLHLVSAYGLPSGITLPESASTVPAALSHLSWVIATAAHAEAAVADSAATASQRGLEPVPHVRRGDPADVLIAIAEEEGADLIVVGSKGMGGPGRFLLGAVPDKVSHHAPCSVLVARSA